MKKKIVITSIILIIIFVPIIIININKKEENNSYTIETYIDGKLAASLPSSGSGYEFDSITCDDSNVKATFNYSTWRVEVTNINGKTKCTVKFKTSDKPTLVNYLKENTNLVEEHGLRYEGKDVDVHNYVLFNDELWRIIGIFEVDVENGAKQELVKLIRANELYGLLWGTNNTWEGSTLQKSLNNGYLNKKSEKCSICVDVDKTCNFSETGINTGAREKIEAVKWNIGKSANNATAEAIYTTEIAEQTTDYYKVGLMSASDYGFAVKSASCGRTTNLSSYNTSACTGENWLKNIGYEWTLTPGSSSTNNVLYVFGEGYVNSNTAREGRGIRPSVYLKSTVLYISGDGNRSTPFIIAN